MSRDSWYLMRLALNECNAPAAGTIRDRIMALARERDDARAELASRTPSDTVQIPRELAERLQSLCSRIGFDADPRSEDVQALADADALRAILGAK